MVTCTLWLEFGCLFDSSHSYPVSVSEISFDTFINDLSNDYRIDIEEEFDKDLKGKFIRFYASKNTQLRSYLGSKFIHEIGGDNE